MLYMTTYDSVIDKFILECRNVVVLLEDHGVVLTENFKTLWRAFELCKDTYFFEYMGCKNESYQEGDIPTPSVTLENLLNFALEKYTDLS